MVIKASDNTITMSDKYSLLKTEVIKSILTSQTLPTNFFEMLLSRYKQVIASPRTISILRKNRNLHDLLNILEDRDYLSFTDWSVLVDLANFLGCTPTRDIIEHYINLWNPTFDTKCFICGKDESQLITKPAKSISIPALSSPHKLSEEEPASNDLDVAIERISRRLGRSWKDLARTKELGFNEYDIEGLQEDHKRMADQIRYMFRDWREREGNKATVPKLVTALIKARRRDLADRVTDSDS